MGIVYLIRFLLANRMNELHLFNLFINIVFNEIVQNRGSYRKTAYYPRRYGGRHISVGSGLGRSQRGRRRSHFLCRHRAFVSPFLQRLSDQQHDGAPRGAAQGASQNARYRGRQRHGGVEQLLGHGSHGDLRKGRYHLFRGGAASRSPFVFAGG